MSAVRKLIWWLALPWRLACTAVILVIIFPLYPSKDEGVLSAVRDLWRIP